MLLIRILADNLKNLEADLIRDLNIQPYAMRCLRSTIEALDTYYVDCDAEKFQQRIFPALIEALASYDLWVERDTNTPRTKILHEYILRHSKGILKALRIWRIDGFKK